MEIDCAMPLTPALKQLATMEVIYSTPPRPDPDAPTPSGSSRLVLPSDWTVNTATSFAATITTDWPPLRARLAYVESSIRDHPTTMGGYTTSAAETRRVKGMKEEAAILRHLAERVVLLPAAIAGVTKQQ